MTQRKALTTRRPSLLQARQPSVSLLFATAVVVLGIASSLSSPAAAQDDIVVEDTNYYYTIFENAVEGVNSVDGPSGVGKYGMVGYGGALVDGSVVFSDMGGSGSAIRRISRDGRISTIAGSLERKGSQDGLATEALFGGLPSGNRNANPLVYTSGSYYMADTANSLFRLIDATTGQTTTLLSTNVLRNPFSLALLSANSNSIFISNAGHQQVLYIADMTAPVGTVLPPGELAFTPGAITVFPQLNRLFVVDSGMQIRCWYYKPPDSESWPVGNPRETDFGRILSTSSDGTRLLYVSGDGNKILSLDATASREASQTLAPQVVMTLNPTVMGGDVQLFFERSADSWFILTDNQFLIASKTPITPEESSNPPTLNRFEGIAAFPSNAFPLLDRCLMTEVFHQMRLDAAEAYGTTDFFNVFLAPSGIDATTLVNGNVDISTWCTNITTPYSDDGTILILPFWGPTSMSTDEAQNRFAGSTWSRTRIFLDILKNSGWELGPFCFFDCRTSCQTITAPQCMAGETESICDDVCKGAIVSAAVIGAAGVVLVVLMIASPMNIFRAFVMVPII